MNVLLAQSPSDPRKKKKKDKKRRSRGRKLSHSTSSASKAEISTILSPEPEPKKINNEKGLSEHDQPSVGKEGKQGKQSIATDSCLNSGETPTDSCTCVKINGYCAHSKILINGCWFSVTDLTPVGNNGRRLKATFPRGKELVRPRLKDVINKMKAQKNAATEEALARSRGIKAYRSWKVKKANEALAREIKEEEAGTTERQPNEDSNTFNFPSSPSSRLETSPLEDAIAAPQPPSPTVKQEDTQARKRKHKANRGERPKKRRRVSAHLQSNHEDAVDTTETIDCVVQEDEMAMSRHQETNIAQTSGSLIVMEAKMTVVSHDSLQEQGKVSLSLEPERDMIQENHMVVYKDEKIQDWHIDPSKVQQPRPSSIVNASETTADRQDVVDMIETQCGRTLANKGIAVKSTAPLPTTATIDIVHHDSGRREAEEVENVAGNSATKKSGKALAKPHPISLDDSSEDDVQIVSVNSSAIQKRQTQSKRLDSSLKNIAPHKPHNPPKPGLNLPPLPFPPAIPATTPSQVGTKEPKSVVNPSSSTARFPPALVERLLNTKPGPIAVDEDLEEELTSPESSPGPGVAGIQIEVSRSKEVRFVRQEPTPISISSDSDEDMSVPRKRTLSDLRTQYRTNTPKAAHGTTTAQQTITKNANHQSEQPERTNEHAQISKRHDVWPEETRGAVAQAATEYLNELVHNKQSQMAVPELLHMLGKQPDFNMLCSQILISGRTLAKPAFAKAILSKLQPKTDKTPGNGKSVRHTDASPRSGEITPTRPASNTPKKRTQEQSLGVSATKSSAEVARSNKVKAAPMSTEIISLDSPGPNPPNSTSPGVPLIFQTTPRNPAKAHRSDTASKSASLDLEVSNLDLPATIPTTNPQLLSKLSHKQSRKVEVLDYVAERLLLHEGLKMLPQLLEFLVEKTVKKEADLFKAEQAVAKRSAEKGAKDSKRKEEHEKTRRRLDFRCGKDVGERVEETPPKRKQSEIEWNWNNSEDAHSRKRVRGRSTSVALPSNQSDQARPVRSIQTPCPQYTQRNRGRSTTPMLWLSQSTRNETRLPGKERSASVSTTSDDDFFDAKERMSTESTGSVRFEDASEGGVMVLVGGTPVRKEDYVDFSVKE
jgi:hypothetical protein